MKKTANRPKPVASPGTPHPPASSGPSKPPPPSLSSLAAPSCLTVSTRRWRSLMTQPLKSFRGNASRDGHLCGSCVFFMLYFEARWAPANMPGSPLIPGLGQGMAWEWPAAGDINPRTRMRGGCCDPRLAGHQGLRSSPPNHRSPVLHPWNSKSESAHLSCGLELPHTGLHGEGSGEPPAGLEVWHAHHPPSLQALSGHVASPPVPPLPVLPPHPHARHGPPETDFRSTCFLEQSASFSARTSGALR